MRFVLIAVLMFAAISARAEWTMLGETDKAVYYLDPATIRGDGSLRRIWELQELKARGMDGELSRRVLYEYDCERERERGLSASSHSGPLTTGELLASISETGKWNHVAVGTIGDILLRRVCARQ